MSEAILQAAARRGLTVPPPPHDEAALAELAVSVFLHPQRGLRRMPREQGYLAAARTRSLRSGVGALAAWEWGAPDAPLIGLVHGWEGHGAQLGAFAAPLAAAGFRVLAFDAPGHGDSPGDEAHVPLLARLLAEIECETGRFFGMVGHSMGAAGAAMSTQHGTAPRGLVLLAPPQSQLERVVRVAERMKLTGGLREKFHAAVERRTGARFAEVDMRVVAERAPCPLLVFHDPADEDTSFVATEEVVARWRGARLVPAPGRGHYRIVVTPEIVRQTVEFLSALR